jgi:hypothetical protein
MLCKASALALFILCAQDDAKARRAKLAELKAKLASTEKERIAALEELGTLQDDPEAGEILASRLKGDSADVRIAAARAVAKHRRQASLNALVEAVPAYFRDPLVAGVYVDAVADLDLCASIKVLLQFIELDNFSRADDALRALGRIGCPEATPALIALMRKAELEARKPDQIEIADAPIIPGQAVLRPKRPPGALRFRDNSDKNKILASLAGATIAALSRVTGAKHETALEWDAAYEAGKLSFKLVSVYRCEKTRRLFDVKGSKKACPHAEGLHNDTFLKHRKA